MQRGTARRPLVIGDRRHPRGAVPAPRKVSGYVYFSETDTNVIIKGAMEPKALGPCFSGVWPEYLGSFPVNQRGEDRLPAREVCGDDEQNLIDERGDSDSCAVGPVRAEKLWVKHSRGTTSGHGKFQRHRVTL